MFAVRKKTNGVPEDDDSIIKAAAAHRESAERLRTTLNEVQADGQLTPTPIATPSGKLIVAVQELMKVHGDDCPTCSHIRYLLGPPE